MKKSEGEGAQDTGPELDALEREAEALEGQHIPGGDAGPGAGTQGQPGPGNPNTQEMAALIANVLDLTMNGVIAPRRGQHWAMRKDETDALGDAYAAVIEKYCPDMNFGPEVTAIGLTLMCFGPRVMADTRARKSKPEQGGDGDDGQREPKPRRKKTARSKRGGAGGKA